MTRRHHRDILRYGPQITRLAQKIAKGAPHWIDIRDLEQDAYLALLAAAPRYDGSTQFFTFIYPRMAGAMIDGLRRWQPRSRRRDAPFVLWRPLADADSWPAEGGDPEAATRAREVREALLRLPPRWAHVLKRRFFDEADHHTIARELGVTVNRVHQLHRKALDTLRAHFT